MSEPAPTNLNELRWQLLGDLAVFTAKAGLEALRDLVLIPVVLTAGIVGIAVSPQDPGRFFRRVLSWGDRYDHFVDLFGSVRHRERAGMTSAIAPNEVSADAGTTADDVFEGIEALLVEQHEKGGVTAAAKETIDRALDVLQDAVDELRGPTEPRRAGDAKTDSTKPPEIDGPDR